MTQPLNDLGALVAHRSLLQEYLEIFIFHQQPKYVNFFNKKSCKID
jgi:hypothetical protein